MSELQDSQIQDIFRQVIKEALTDDEEMLVTRKPRTRDEIKDETDAFELLLSGFREDLTTSNHERVQRQVDEILEGKGLELGKDSYSYEKLCRVMLKAQILNMKKASGCRLNIKLTMFRVPGHLSAIHIVSVKALSRGFQSGHFPGRYK